jgi:hypothetical protein
LAIYYKYIIGYKWRTWSVRPVPPVQHVAALLLLSLPYLNSIIDIYVLRALRRVRAQLPVQQHGTFNDLGFPAATEVNLNPKPFQNPRLPRRCVVIVIAVYYNTRYCVLFCIVVYSTVLSENCNCRLYVSGLDPDPRFNTDPFEHLNTLEGAEITPGHPVSTLAPE